MKRTPAGLIALALLVSSAALAGVIHVPGEAPTIQAGINAASVGDTVLIACDTFHEHGIEMKSGVCLTSETGDPSCVTIDGDGADRVLHCSSVDNSASIIAITFTHGDADGGSGIFCEDSSVRIRGCRFIDNHALVWGGAGLYCVGGTPSVTDCTFEDNTCSAEGSWPAGGGLALETVSGGRVARCTFRRNEAVYGGGLACHGQCTTAVDSCDFLENAPPDTALGFGGGAYFGGSIDAQVVGCSFHGNSAWSGGGVHSWANARLSIETTVFSENTATLAGGGLNCDGGETDASYCTFEKNSAEFGAAVALYNGASVNLENCSLVLNVAPGRLRGGAIYVWNPSIIALLNSIIAFNMTGAAVICEEERSAALTCTDVFGNDGGDWTECIEGQGGSNGNLNVDPRFCGLLAGDYELCANSPCLDPGGQCGALIGALGQGCGDCNSVVEKASWGSIKAMFR